jgi:hypothetical protein
MTALTVRQTPTSLAISTTTGHTLLSSAVARDLAARPDRAATVAVCEAMIAHSSPSTVSQVAATYERLAVHYPPSARLSPGQVQSLKADWLRLLGHLPPDILQEAADRYLMSEARFMPTPGQLNAIAAPIWSVRQILARRAREALDLICEQVAA